MYIQVLQARRQWRIRDIMINNSSRKLNNSINLLANVTMLTKEKSTVSPLFCRRARVQCIRVDAMERAGQTALRKHPCWNRLASGIARASFWLSTGLDQKSLGVLFLILEGAGLLCYFEVCRHRPAAHLSPHVPCRLSIGMGGP